MAIDLHTHTNRSDGSLSPEELLQRAHACGVQAVAITDHDTVDAYSPELFSFAQSCGVELIPGIEISTRDEVDRYHVLGLLVDPHSEQLRTFSNEMVLQRKANAEEMVAALRSHNWAIDDSFLQQNASITKAQVAIAVLENPSNTERVIKEFGSVPTYGDFIEAWLIKGCPCYVRRAQETTPQQAIDIIHEAQGLALLAHPTFNIMNGYDARELCEKFLNLGVDGFEAINVQFDHSTGAMLDHREFLTQFAQEHGLVISGGSDFHDYSEGQRAVDLGYVNHPWVVDYGVLDGLREYKNKKYSRG